MSHPTDVEGLLAQYGWVAEGDTQSEGEADRTPVVLEDGTHAFLYTFEDSMIATRAAVAYGDMVGEKLFVVPSRIDAGPGWVLVEEVDGTNLADLLDGGSIAELGQHRAMIIVRGIGKTLRKLHEIAGERYGDVMPDDEGVGTYLTFSGWAAHQLEAFVEHVRGERFDDATVALLAERIAQMRHELAAYHPRTAAGLSHGRPQAAHIWIGADDEVVGLTGFHHVGCLPRELDIAHLLWIDGVGDDEQLVREFYKSYGAARTMDVQRRERFFRQLAAFLALSGRRGPSPRSEAELIALTER